MQDILAREAKTLVNNKTIIKEPQFIKVQVVNRKIYNQIKETNLTYDDSFLDLKMIILGMVDGWIVYSDESKKLKKMQSVDYVGYYCYEKAKLEGGEEAEASEKRKQNKRLMDEAKEEVKQIPVMFVG